jgi:hypothetical protein
MDEVKKQVCSIRIMFPVESDEQAIEYKKKLTANLVNIPNATVQFSLTSTDGLKNLPFTQV